MKILPVDGCGRRELRLSFFSVPGCSPTRACISFSFAVWALALWSCGSGGGGSGTSSGIPGQELDKPDGTGTFIVDPSHGGTSSRLHVVEMFWGRLVDVHEIDGQGRTNPVPVYRNFAINENVQSDPGSFRLEANPITQETRLVILRQRGTPDGSFNSLLRSSAEGLPPIVPKNDNGSSTEPFSYVARNAVIILRFDDVLSDGEDAQRDLYDAVRVLTGYASNSPEVRESGRTPFQGQLLFDPNYGAIVNGGFHSTRILIDLTVSETESSTMLVPQPLNAVGLPASLTSNASPNVSVRLPTRTNFGSGQFKLVRNLSGAPLSESDNGPVDHAVPTHDIVRAMRSGNPSDLNNGFMLDLNSPKIVGGWALRLDSAIADPKGQSGFDYLLDATFTTVCRRAPSVGDVISQTGIFLEIAQDGPIPDAAGEVLGLRVRNLSDSPIERPSSIIGNALFLSTFEPTVSVPTGCWISFTPQPDILPSIGIATSSQVLVRFSEPMDPVSITPFDSLYVVRGDSSTAVVATSLIVGSITPSADLKEFAFNPKLDLPHNAGASETYHVRLSGPTDLAGNSLSNQLPAVNFTMDPSEAPVSNGGTVLRFNGADEMEPFGLADLRGQFFLDADRGVIRPRQVVFTAYPADRLNPVPSIMIPYPPGVQTPLSPLGSKLQTVWRYCDLGFQVRDETKYNLDVFGLSWAPIGGQVINDFFENFEIRLSHSSRLPDENIDANLLPDFTGSGLVGDPDPFDENILRDPISPQKVVHNRSLGYQITSADLYLSSSGTIMLPFPLNRGPGTPITFTWRDTAALGKGGSGGVGVPLHIEEGVPLSLEDNVGYVARGGNVPTFGLPLLMEYRCYPSNTGLGLNALDISLAINSSAVPSFRSYTTGGIKTGIATVRNPDQSLVPEGGFNPTSRPPGKPTARTDDNSFYIGQLDAVTRISRVHTVWINTNLQSPDFIEPVVLPAADEQPTGTQVVLEFRGSGGFVLSDLDTVLGGIPTDESSFPFDSTHLDPYGEIFAVIPERRVDTYETLGSSNFLGGVQFITGNNSWVSAIDEIDGAQYVQVRISFLGSIQSGLSSELSAIGIAYSER